MLLQPYRVLDLTGALGFVCSKILADLGADVIKIEPRDGDPARHTPPLLQMPGGEGQSLAWLAFNVNKRGITLDLQSSAGEALLLRLLATADFLIESSPPGTLDNLGLGYEVLRKHNPKLILVSITPFGKAGPYCDFRASDLEIMALSGAMSCGQLRSLLRA